MVPLFRVQGMWEAVDAPSQGSLERVVKRWYGLRLKETAI
jgi:hypothetical protein